MSEETNQTIPLPSTLQDKIEEVEHSNPLANYFRHAKVNIMLPTGGKFWPEGSLVTKEDGSIDVMAMTAKDEIIMKSPDGLLSGTSIAETILSCVPGIKDPWVIPGFDMDAILMAIRLASYEHDMTITTNCPECKASNVSVLDVRYLLDSISREDIKHIFKIDELTFEFKPYDFRYINLNNKAKFDQEQMARSIIDNDIADKERSAYFTKLFKDLADQGSESLVFAIDKISLPDGIIVRDKEQINEFITNCDRAMIKKIKDTLTSMNSSTSMSDVAIVCDECGHEYNTAVEFNQANFFE